MQHQRQKDTERQTVPGEAVPRATGTRDGRGARLPSVRNPRMTAHANGVLKMRLSAMFAE